MQHRQLEILIPSFAAVKRANAIVFGFVSLLPAFFCFPMPSAVAQSDDVQLYFPCATCHGSNGEGVPAKYGPALAGLSVEYVEAELLAFANGTRGGNPADRHGGEMALVAKAYSPEALKIIAEIVAAFDPPKILHDQEISVSAARGRYVYQRCAICHGEFGQGDQSQNAPRLAGQDPEYLQRQMRNYRTGLRGGQADDQNGQVMGSFVTSGGSLSVDDEEIATYLASLVERQR